MTKPEVRQQRRTDAVYRLMYRAGLGAERAVELLIQRGMKRTLAKAVVDMWTGDDGPMSARAREGRANWHRQRGCTGCDGCRAPRCIAA